MTLFLHNPDSIEKWLDTIHSLIFFLKPTIICHYFAGRFDFRKPEHKAAAAEIWFLEELQNAAGEVTPNPQGKFPTRVVFLDRAI